MVAHHTVLRRRPILAQEPRCAAAAGLLDERLECRELHLPAKHAATHQPGVDAESAAGFELSDNDSDDPIISVHVGEPELQGEPLRIGEQFENLRFHVPAGRKVELIRLVDELNHPSQIFCSEWCQASSIFKPLRKLSTSVAL